MTDDTPYFVDLLKILLEKARERKSQEPKSDSTRHWAIVHTDLEKVLAYTKTYIVKVEKGNSE